MNSAEEQLRGCLGREFAYLADVILNKHAHELAEWIRKEGHETSGQLGRGMLRASDLIDPDVLD